MTSQRLPRSSGSTPSVAVIVPVFNRPTPLAEAVQSIREQGRVQATVVIVDDASDDGQTPAVIDRLVRSDPRVTTIRLPLNRGPAAARNRGVEVCDDELITFLDSDDLMTPNRLDHQLEYLLKNRSQQALVGRLRHHIDPEVEIPEAMKQKEISSGDEALYPMTLMIWRDTFNALGGFDEDFRFGEDVDLITRLCDDFSMGKVDDVYTVRRILGDNLSYDAEAMRRSLFQLLRKKGLAKPDPTTSRNKAR